MTLQPMLIFVLVPAIALAGLAAVIYWLRRVDDPVRRQLLAYKTMVLGLIVAMVGLGFENRRLSGELSQCHRSVTQAFEDGLNSQESRGN